MKYLPFIVLFIMSCQVLDTTQFEENAVAKVTKDCACEDNYMWYINGCESNKLMYVTYRRHANRFPDSVMIAQVYVADTLLLTYFDILHHCNNVDQDLLQAGVAPGTLYKVQMLNKYLEFIPLLDYFSLIQLAVPDTISMLPPTEYSNTPIAVRIGLGSTPAHDGEAPLIMPLDGKTVMVALGASTPKQIADRLKLRTAELSNPEFGFANLCQGSQDLDDWLTETVWKNAMNKLTHAGFTAEQVQIAWIMEEDLFNPDVSFPSRAYTVAEKYEAMIALAKLKFPNLKQVFISGRIYTGWTDIATHKEPIGYYNGWAAKFTVEDQIKGRIPASPWISDKANMWTDNSVTRADGLQVSKTDFLADGVHLTAAGEAKLGDWLFEFLKKDAAALPYFY